MQTWEEWLMASGASLPSVRHVSQFMREMYQEMLGIQDDDDDRLIRVAALGLTLSAWRNSPIEVLHSSPDGPSDYEMFISNVKTTAQVADTLRTDTGRLTLLLTDPDRSVGALTASSFCGPFWRDVQQWARERCDSYQRTFLVEAKADVLWVAASTVAVLSSYWWGSVDWETLVDRYFNRIGEQGDLRDRAKNDPETITEEEFSTHIQKVQFELRPENPVTER